MIGYKSRIPKKTIKPRALKWQNYIHLEKRFFSDNSFVFINLKKEFIEDRINWNEASLGKLWTYNLNYFDFLHQPDMTRHQGLKLIEDYIDKYDQLEDGLEPYPTSLRIMNWVKFINLHKIDDHNIATYLSRDCYRLSDNLEYHLLANHLLENGFALLFGGLYLGDEYIFKKGESILLKELEEQILPDGAHYELSPMYHQLMLLRVLDTIQLLKINERSSTKILVSTLTRKAAIMLSWLEQITFDNGGIPNFGDSIDTLNTRLPLLAYAEKLHLSHEKKPLGESGYRMIKRRGMECCLDIGNILPAYQPAHAHADTFHFTLHIDEKPFLVDTGLSTYERGERRDFERSTAAHNTVTIDNENSSEVWASHRVGRRARVKVIEENEQRILASHDGYRRFGITCRREWRFEDRQMIILDEISKGKGIAHFHFHEEYSNFQRIDETILFNKISIQFEGASEIKMKKYHRASKWNELVESTKLEIHFIEKLGTTINWK